MATEPILTSEGVHKRYGGVHALRGAQLAINPGEVHALVGENGSGKSTVIKMLSGAYQPDAGNILKGGVPVVLPDPSYASSMGVATVSAMTFGLAPG